jgi:short-subunit dehydrogenase
MFQGRSSGAVSMPERNPTRPTASAALAPALPVIARLSLQREIAKMPGRFAERVAVITGASSGIGWCMAKELAREGCKVGLVARRKDRLDALADEIRQDGGIAVGAAADVGNREQTVAAIHDLARQLGPIDLLIANAGVSTATHYDPPNTTDIEKTFRVNIFGMVYAFEAVLPEMVRRRQGHLAAVSSLASYKGLPGHSAYCASKAAINIYLEALRIQMRNFNIAVTTVCPGFIRTPITADHSFRMPFLMEPEVAARRIIRALYWKRKVYNFPWRMSMLIKLTWLAPDWLMNWITGPYYHHVSHKPIE